MLAGTQIKEGSKCPLSTYRANHRIRRERAGGVALLPHRESSVFTLGAVIAGQAGVLHFNPIIPDKIGAVLGIPNPVSTLRLI